MRDAKVKIIFQSTEFPNKEIYVEITEDSKGGTEVKQNLLHPDDCKGTLTENVIMMTLTELWKWMDKTIVKEQKKWN